MSFRLILQLRASALLATALTVVSAHAIVGGTLDSPTSPYRYVGQLSSGVGGATPIAPNWLITANHINAQVGQTFTNPDGTFTIAEVRSFASPTSAGQRLDFDLLRVTGTPAAPTLAHTYAYANVPTNSMGLISGVTATLVGYGQIGVPNAMGYTPANNPSGGRYIGYNALDAKVFTNLRNDNTASGNDFIAYAYDLDGPNGNGNLGGPAVPGEAGIALNDSGSGWFVEVNGTPVLIAVSSGVTNVNAFAYGDVGVGVSLGDYTDRIQSTTGVGPVAPVPEPASFAALGLGALALLRRRRRA